MRTEWTTVLLIALLCAAGALTPFLSPEAKACSSMSGMDMASGACCGSKACDCGMKKQDGPMELAMAPSNLPVAPQFLQTPVFYSQAPLASVGEPAREGLPIDTSQKDKLYDSQSSQRL